MKPITIMICTYNGEKYLEKVLQSILEQNKLYELVEKVVVVDNASTDETKSIVEKFIKKNSIFDYEYEPEMGLANGRKHIVNVKTKWTLFFDDDNILMENCLIAYYKLADSESNIGVVNGNSIAYPDFNITDREKIILKRLRTSLACTHVVFEPDRTPVEDRYTQFGAGMMILTEPVKKKIKEGKWLKSIGRCGESLNSGEDSELMRIMYNLGYIHGYAQNAWFYHYIPKKRVEEEYVTRLVEALTHSNYNYLSYEKFYVLRRVKRMLLAIKFLVFTSTPNMENDFEEYYDIYLKRVASRVMLKLIWRDKILLRK